MNKAPEKFGGLALRGACKAVVRVLKYTHYLKRKR